jgi:hypothetical protein
MCATSFCNAPLDQNREQLGDEIGMWLDAIDDQTRQQQPKTGGRPPIHEQWRPLFPAWLKRFEGEEPFADLMTEAGVPESDHESVRNSFEYWCATGQ